MTAKQKIFADEFLIDLNGTAAAIRAGYSERTARSIASENLTKPDIVEYIQAQQNKRAERIEISQDYVLKVIKDTIERCSQAEEVVDRFGMKTGEYKFDAQAVLKGAELLGKHLVMFTDKIKTDATINLKDFKVTDLIGFKE